MVVTSSVALLGASETFFRFGKVQVPCFGIQLAAGHVPQCLLRAVASAPELRMAPCVACLHECAGVMLRFRRLPHLVPFEIGVGASRRFMLPMRLQCPVH
jgi:hypothetical protein